MGKKETYAMAQARLLEEMPRKFPQTGVSDGYEAVTYNRGSVLKYPYLLFGSRHSRSGPHKLTFTAQAIHDEGGLSLWVDIRGMSAEELDRIVRNHYR